MKIQVSKYSGGFEMKYYFNLNTLFRISDFQKGSIMHVSPSFIQSF